jgi:hypothetical protein
MHRRYLVAGIVLYAAAAVIAAQQNPATFAKKGGNPEARR